MRGAALATLIARIIELACSVAVSYRKDYIHPQVKYLFHRNKKLTRDFAKCALPLLGACLFWGIGFTSYSSFMGHLGVDATAANSVAAVVRDLVCCLSAGISGAAGIMIGNELGAGNLDRGKEYGIRLLKISFLCGIVAAALMCILAPIILHFVKLTPQATSYLKGMLGVIAFYMIGRAVNDVTINGVSALVETLYLICTVSLCVCGVWQFHWLQQEPIISTGRWLWFMHVPVLMKWVNCPGYFIISENING